MDKDKLLAKVEPPTLDSLERWWAGHPDATAKGVNACRCIVTEPLHEQHPDLVFTFVPGTSTINVWPATPGQVREQRGTDVLAEDYIGPVVVDYRLDELAQRFDYAFPSGVEAATANQCLRLIRATMKEED